MMAYWFEAWSGLSSESITSLKGASAPVAGLAGLVALLMSF